ncbi:MAG: peptidase S8, partial [Symploca sp. SIO3E6]|nr:peptidase S8 [Caldora sp. SIO3E6]
SGRSSYESHYAKLSSRLQSGRYYLLWKADATGRVAEGNESNNIGYRSINITGASKPDLVVQSQYAPTSAKAGSTIRLRGYVKNQGSSTATSSYLKYYLSTDTSLSSSDTYLGQDYVRRLSSGRSSYESHYAKLSSRLQSGRYYLLWKADATGRVAEGNESNNVGYRSINITGAPQPDLIIQNQSAASSVTAGSTLNITYSLKNQGSANASGNNTKFYLSTDATYSSNDIQLGSDYISSVSAGSTLNRSKSLSISSSITAGNYYLLWKADANGNVSESNENNNVVSKYITVNSAKPDLIIKNQLAASSVT